MIKRNSPVSMYEQIANTLRINISENKYSKTLGFIGTQGELAKTFSVSIITIRKAVDVLTKESLVTSKQGKGIFVKSFTVSDRLNKLTGLTNIMAEANLVPKVIVKSLTEINTPDYFDDDIKKMIGKKCIFIERIHVIDETVSGYARLYLPLEYGSKLTKEDLENNTIYELYQNKLNVVLGKGIQNIKAEKAKKVHSDIMKIETGSPMLFIERFSYSEDGSLLEVMELFYEYTQYYFRVESSLSVK